MPAATGRAARGARPRSRSITLLIVGPMLCAIALTSLAYLGLSQQAQRDTLAHMGVAALAARGAIQANMGDLKVTNGQLASALPANVTTLNNNNGEAKQLHTLTGVDTLIAQREQSGLVVIASSLAPASAGATLGARLGGSLASNACANAASPTAGSLSLAGESYIAGAAPLVDGSGACVGAVIAVTSVSAMRATTLGYTIILALAGALLALVTAVVGLMLHGREQPARQPLGDERVRAALDALDAAQADCAEQAEQRAWLGRRLATGRGHMRRLMATLAIDRVALQEATSDVWAGVSHPGAPVDPAIAMRLARESAVVAARIGSRLNDVDAVAADLFADLDAADDLDQRLDDALTQADAALDDLRTVIAPSAEGLASRPRGRRESDARDLQDLQDLYDTNRVEAQPQRTAQTPRVAPSGAQGAAGVSRFSGSYPAVRADSSQHRAARGESGRQQAMRSDSAQYRTLFNQGSQGASGQRPAVHRADAPGASGASGVQRTEWQAASSSGRHRAQPRPPQPRNPGNPFGAPQDGRDRDSSGSRWLND